MDSYTESVSNSLKSAASPPLMSAEAKEMQISLPASANIKPAVESSPRIIADQLCKNYDCQAKNKIRTSKISQNFPEHTTKTSWNLNNLRKINEYQSSDANINSLIPERTKLQQRLCNDDAEALQSLQAYIEGSGYNDRDDFAESGEFQCNFDSPIDTCRFYSAPEATVQWKSGRFVDANKQFLAFFTNYMLRSAANKYPNDNFLYIIGRNSKDAAESGNASLRAKIDCQIDDGKLYFDLWKSRGECQVKVCTVTDSQQSCSETIRADEQAAVDVEVVHPKTNPFAVEIVVSDVDENCAAIVDNIVYEAKYCSNNEWLTIYQDKKMRNRNNGKVNNSKRLRMYSGTSGLGDGIRQSLMFDQVESFDSQRNSQKSKNACELINCSFNGNLCNYFNSAPVRANFGLWKVAPPRNQRLVYKNGRRVIDHKDNRHAGGFAYVGTDHRLSGHQQRTVYVLESAPFALDQDSVLSFDVYKRTNSISLQVCLNTMTNCVYTAPKSEKKVLWRHDEQVFLPKNTTKIFFVAEQVRKSRWLAIDHTLLNYDGLPCEQ